MSSQTHELRLAIYRNEPALGWSLYQVDTGALLQLLTLKPSELTGGIEGTLRLEVERTRESELLLAVALVGGQAFLEGMLSELGKRFVDWLAKQAAKLGARSPAAVRPEEGEDLIIEVSDLARAEREIVRTLEATIKSGTTVKLIVESGA